MANPYAIFKILDFFTDKEINEVFTAKQIGDVLKEPRAETTGKLFLLHKKGMLERRVINTKPVKSYGYWRKPIQEHNEFLTKMYVKGLAKR